MPTVKLQIGLKAYQFEASDDKSLLDYALESGAPVNYSCKRGDCAQCVGTLTTGHVTALLPSLPLRVNDDVYLCNALACGDIELKLPYFPELDGNPALRSPAKIHELRALNRDVVEVALRLPPSIGFRFLPGQFVRLTTKDKLTRSYSLAAGLDSSKLLRIHVRKVEGGAFSDYLFSRARPGDLLHLEGPQGHFFVRDADTAAKTLFLATGTGIAPIYAMLSSLPAERRAALGEVHVYWGNRFCEDEYLAAELRSLASAKGFQYWPIYSREAGAGPRHVQDLVARHHPDLSACVVFACGSVAMIDSSRKTTEALGLPAGRFRSDPFTRS